MTHPALGSSLSEVPTPALVLDLDAFEANCQTLASHLSARGVDWRPHIKGHKSPVLARRMVEAGASGVTCAKVGEAEVMVAAGIQNVLVANQPATVEAWTRLARLQRVTWVGVAIDSEVHMQQALAVGSRYGVAIPLLIEVDIGMGRAGVPSPEAAVALARSVTAAGGELAGVMGYEGHLLTVWPQSEKEKVIGEAVARVVEAAGAIREASIAVPIVSCGGSGSYEISSEIPGVTEIQAGGGCLMDRFYRESCHVDLQQALYLVSAVGSRPGPGRAILDAGWKALPDRLLMPGCADIPDAVVSQLYAEHLRLEWDEGDGPEIGDRVRFIPGYSDATTFLHNEFLGVRDGKVVEVIPLEARGALT